ncbi:hypothetical protein EV715DRAFT_278331 [Schizophyllum commune]
MVGSFADLIIERVFPHDAHDVATDVELIQVAQSDRAAFARAEQGNYAPSCYTPPPINHLPNEILCAIFLLTGDPSPASVFPRDPMMHPYELDHRKVQLYSKVCVRWRAVTRSYPPLWTIVDVDVPGKKATRCLQQCLDHSAGLPLTLWISRSLKFGGDKSVDPRFMPLVASNAHRWEEISIELWRERECLQPLISLSPGTFIALRRARAQASTPDTLLWRLDTVDWIRKDYIQAGLAEAPWHQLTRLGLHWIEPSVLYPFLSSCTRLEELLVSIDQTILDQQHAGPLPIPSPLRLPHLRVLMLCGPANWERLFSSLAVPSLERLDVSRMHIHGGAIERMLRTSNARLGMLAIHWPAKNEGDIVLALLRSSCMQYLQILRYERYYKDGWNLGWEDTFDLRPFVPNHIAFTESAAQAERDYAQMRRFSTIPVVNPYLTLPLHLPPRRERCVRWNAIDAQYVCDEVYHAERPSPRTHIPAGTDVVSSHEGSDLTTPEKHGLTRAGRKIDAVNGPKNAPLRSSQSVATPKTSIDKQTYIDRLPNEILCAIFLICGDPSPASIFPRDYDMHAYDMEAHRVKPYSGSVALLGRVCARWYAVTRGSPTLWTVVDVAYPTREATSVLKLCLKHSAGLPLSLWISNSLRPDARAKGVDPHFMALVAANASRWTELSIELRDEVFVLQTLTTLPSGAFSSLRRARIKFYGRKTQESNADTLLLKQFFTSPSLDCVDLTRTGYIETGLAFAPLHQLTSLGMHRAKPDMVSTVLRNCTSLELLYIRIEPFAFGRAGNVPLSIPFPSCLPRLRVLFFWVRQMVLSP